MSVNKRIKLAIAAYIMDEITSLGIDNGLIELLAILQSNSSASVIAATLERQEHVRMPNFYEEWISRYVDFDFYMLFRMNRQSQHFLLREIGIYHKIQEHHGGRMPIPLEKSLLMTLWYLGKGDTLISISDRFNVSISTVHKLIEHCLVLILKLDKKFICWPKESERNSIEQEFRLRSDFPGIIGAIDGCHIHLKVPVEQQGSYLNRKFFHSINIQGICTPNKYLSNVFVGFPGSAHDARVLQYSEIYKKTLGSRLNLFGSYHLVGDSAYPCLEWLMTPFKDNGRLTNSQKKYNYALSKARVTIEHSFGLLKGRWRILKNIDVLSIEKGVDIVMACVILHNFCLINIDTWEISDNSETELSICTENLDFKLDQQNGIIKRDRICNSFL